MLIKITWSQIPHGLLQVVDMRSIKGQVFYLRYLDVCNI